MYHEGRFKIFLRPNQKYTYGPYQSVVLNWQCKEWNAWIYVKNLFQTKLEIQPDSPPPPPPPAQRWDSHVAARVAITLEQPRIAPTGHWHQTLSSSRRTVRSPIRFLQSTAVNVFSLSLKRKLEISFTYRGPCNGRGSTPAQFMWELWCTNWHRDRFFAE